MSGGHQTRMQETTLLQTGGSSAVFAHVTCTCALEVAYLAPDHRQETLKEDARRKPVEMYTRYPVPSLSRGS